MDGSPSRLVRPTIFMGVYPTDRRSSLIRTRSYRIYMLRASDGWRGPLLVTTAAFIFAGANAAATAIYRRGGTVATTFMIRCAVVYLWNATLVALREGRTAAMRCLLLRTGRRQSSLAATGRGLNGAIMGVLLNLSFVLLTFADGFTIFKGVDTVATVLLSRRVLGDGESLSLRELSAGALTLSGLILIAQPPFLFGGGASSALSVGGILIAAAAGVGSAGFNVFTRALSRRGGPHDGYLPPAMLLSYFMVVVFIYVLLIALLSHAIGLADTKGWEWTRLKAPAHPTDWLLLGLYCLGILSGQLMMAAGYATTRAGIGAFLALTELAFAFVLGVTALGEPTNVLAGVGTAITLLGSVAIVAARSRPRAADAAGGGADGGALAMRDAAQAAVELENK